ncbi:MAG: ATP-binding cassette domain-containing protein [Bacteroidales bacterium]|nr:ATP-binding cassette domain-containing protein [Bacteroidales bacterium]
MDILKAENIHKQFSGHLALNDVSISVPQGSIFGLLGPNGAGKTTLIRIINRITAQDEGKVFFDGRLIQTNDVNQIGYLPEERGLYKKMKVGEQALYLARLKGLDKKLAHERLKYWFDKFEITTWWNKKVEELSKGMQQKVQFIVTVLHKPKLLIFDEPFSGFDPINVNLLKDEILNIKNEGGTIIFSTHNMASVEELCDHIALIHNAKKILDGDMNQIKADFKNNIFEIIYRNSSMNFNEIIPSHYHLLDEKSDIKLKRLKIQIPQNESPNDLLNFAIKHVEVHGFTEILPTMNDIFISKVKGTATTNSHA